MSENVKNCPFCGFEMLYQPCWEKKVVLHPDNKCVLSNQPFFIEAWNTRHQELVGIDEDKVADYFLTKELCIKPESKNYDFHKNVSKRMAKMFCQTFGTTKEQYKANFLWESENEIDKLLYEFANCRTEEYRKEMYEAILIKVQGKGR